ncbi:SSI family serine proteinase inhibitor [Actinomadura litoris]|uniref:Serine protease n=1 Tax=Actinomadura litoris TaxID=2678616 RepID=A0A7K1L4T8_9ACTN|nr:SSI family serine proteinase inhibitor [Actinomadura litoris]MUN39265.1 serine protease [Actinomadura litoris]
MARVMFCAILGSGLLAGGGAVTPAATAAAAPAPATEITLSVVPQPGTPGAPRRTVLTCDPAGPLPRAQQACDELAKAKGDISRVPPQQAACAQVWLPVTASASGRWRGVPIPPFSQTYTNDGCARIAHGHVFDF